MAEEALRDESDVAEDMSDEDRTSVEPDTEPAVDVSDIGAVSGEVEWEVAADDSDGQAREDG